MSTKICSYAPEQVYSLFTKFWLLPNALIEEMRQAFRRSEALLDLEMQNGTKKEEQENKTKSNSQPAQMVVAIDQAETMISQGWRFVAALPKDKAVVEKNGCGL